MRLALRNQERKIKQAILETIAVSNIRLTISDVEKRLAKEHQISREDTQSVNKNLINERELTYIHELGHSFLEKSFHKPLRIGEAIVIKPPECQFDPAEKERVINLHSGASFGTGRHPSTRLSLKSLEYILNREKP